MPLPRRSRARDQPDVVARAAALKALVLAAAGEPAPQAGAAFSPQELSLLRSPAGGWDAQERLDAIWRGESLGTLAWALSLVDELPAFDEPFDHVELARELELHGARLRDDDDIEHARETARLWHWRGRTALLQEQGATELPERWRSFDQLVAAAAMRGYEEGFLPAPLRGDFPAFGKVYRHADAQQRALLLSIAAERHYALEWLCADVPWDEVVTET